VKVTVGQGSTVKVIYLLDSAVPVLVARNGLGT